MKLQLTQTLARRRETVPLIVLFALSSVAGAQSVRGTVTLNVPPTGKAAGDLASQQEFQLRRMGYDEGTVARNRETIASAAQREAAGLSASGDFEYARNGQDTFLLTVGTTTIEGQSRSTVLERYVDGTTIFDVDGTAQVYSGDRRSMARSPIFDIALLGTVPDGFAVVSSEGQTTTFDRTRDDLLERLIVTYRSVGDVSRAQFGFVTPEQYRRPGAPSYTVVADALRNEAGTAVDLSFFAGGSVQQTQEIRLDGPPRPTNPDEWAMPKLGAKVVDMRASTPTNYPFSGSLAPAGSAAATRPYFHPGLLWIGGGLSVLVAGRAFS